MILAITALALLLDRLFGYPKALQEWCGHPVQWIGWLIGALEQRFNRFNDPARSDAQNRMAGVVALSLLLLGVGGAALAVHLLLRLVPYGWVMEAVCAAPFLAQKSLYEHVLAVQRAFNWSLDAARHAVSRIVGRDPQNLDESGVARAALESLAENTSDGIIAPAFWLLIGGLPGIALYKAINTADSMIGHRSQRYNSFGWAAARLDDLVNWPAARLTGFLFVCACWPDSHRMVQSWNSMVRDARRHNSPNAGWSEAAMAGALNITLGGPRAYQGEMLDLPTMGRGRTLLTRDDIGSGLKLYGRALTVFTAAIILAAAVAL